MIKTTGIDHLNINIKNFEETIGFYQKHFGFELKEEGKSGSGNLFKIIGLKDKLYLALYEIPYNEKETGHVNHIGLHVENFDETIKYIKEQGIKITMDTYQYPYSRSIYIEDPNGLEIELSEVFGGDLN